VEVTFVLVDPEAPELPAADGTAACVILIHVIEHIADPFPMLADVHRALRPGGVCLIVTPDFARAWKSFYQDRNHVRPYVTESLSATIEAGGLEVVDAGHVNVRRPFGRLPFLWRKIPALLYSGNALFAVAKVD
jgi:SAM-dependent methyltransferase